jgi:NAD(P)-dependent dehydrogenase (short-subunit alcohol dehydrogenase family)
MPDMQGKVALISGGAEGIGAEIARQFMRLRWVSGRRAYRSMSPNSINGMAQSLQLQRASAS